MFGVEGYWSQQCPARGSGLTHVHWNQCSPDGHPGSDTGHHYGQCCHCGGYASQMAREAVMPPLDVAARLRQMGLITDEGTPVATEQDTGLEDIHAENTPVEPKAITGEGPQGHRWGRGRGEFGWRDERRVEAYVGFAEWLSRNGGGERG